MRIQPTTRNSSVSSMMRTRKPRPYAKFAVLKNIVKRGNKDKGNKKKNNNPYLLLLKRLFIAGSFVFLLALLAGSIVVAIWVSNVSKELVGIDPENTFNNAGTEGDTLIYSKDGAELRRLSGEESREFIKIDDVPDYVKAAFVAAEDKTFYENKGVDIFGIARAALNALQKKEIAGGGSTITQQVVKNAVIKDPSQNLDRKLKELILSIQIAQKYNKDQVLQLYINSIPFGSNFVGLKRAAKAYFNKDVKDLSYAEAALLAGIPNNPARLAPEGYAAVDEEDTYVTQSDGTKIKANVAREWEILDRMNEIADQLAVYPGIKLDKDKIKSAHDEKIVYNFPKTEFKAPHFTRLDGPVYNELKNIFKDQPDVDNYITSKGLRVYTTLDYDMQQKAEAAVAQIDDNTNKIPTSICAYCSSGVSNPTPWNVFGAKNAAMISVDPKTGAVLAYAGSAGFDRSEVVDGKSIDGQVDILQEGVSQGSSMKPFNYMSGFINKGLSPTTTWANFQIDMGGGYKPKNFSLGDVPSLSVTTTHALNNSLNIPAVQSLIAGGVDNYADLLSKMGYTENEISEVKKAGVTATLGAAVIAPWDHAQAYQVLAAGGVRHNLYTVDKVTDREGKVLYEKKPDQGTRIVDEKYTWLIYNILKDYPTVAQIKKDGYDAAGKTGTNDFGPNGLPTSNVFWGFTPDLVTGVWAGNNNNKPLRPLAVGEKLGQWMWTPYMRAVLPKFAKTKTTRPAGIVERAICTDNGMLAPDDDQCVSNLGDGFKPHRGTGLFVDGQFPKTDTGHKTYRVTDCNGTVKLASPADEISGNARDQAFVTFETPTGSSLIQQQINDYAAKLGNAAPPTDTCNISRTSDGSAFYTKISTPSNGTQFNPGDSVTVKADTVATSGSAKFSFDNSVFSDTTTFPLSATYTIPLNTNNGNHTFKVQVWDSNGNTSTASISVQVGNSSSSSVTITMQSPTGKINRNPSTTISASVNPATLSSVNFYYKKHSDPDTSYQYITQASKPANGNTYSSSWNTFNPLVYASGQQYDVIAKSADGTAVSSPVTIEFN